MTVYIGSKVTLTGNYNQRFVTGNYNQRFVIGNYNFETGNMTGIL